MNLEMPIFLSKNWGWVLFYGILMVILGIIAIGAAVFTTIITIYFIAILLIIGGVIALIGTFKFWRHKAGSFILHLIMSLLYIAAGFLLIQHPVMGAVSFTLMLAIFYIVLGIFRIINSVSIKLPHWGWSLFSGIVALLLGILIMANWPAASLYIIGLFVGIELLFNGWAYIMLSIAARKPKLVM